VRRSSIDIIAEILKLGEPGVGKTRIMYGVNMSHTQLNRYIDFLLRTGFLQTLPDSDSTGEHVNYSTTSKGRKLLKDIDRMKELLESNGLGKEIA